jgi:hypothetical protein
VGIDREEGARWGERKRDGEEKKRGVKKGIAVGASRILLLFLHGKEGGVVMDGIGGWIGTDGK